MHELRNVGELKALLLNGDRIPLQEWGLYGERFDGLIDRVRAEAKAEALRDAADIKLGNEYYEMLVEDELNARADQMEGDE